jgi:hypothetical protein
MSGYDEKNVRKIWINEVLHSASQVKNHKPYFSRLRHNVVRSMPSIFEASS